MKRDSTNGGDPYGVPTGYVPRLPDALVNLERARVERMAQLRTDMEHDLLRPAARPADPVTQAVDDWLLMERKARAWDALLRTRVDPVLIAEMNAMVHPAPDHSTR